MVTLLIEYVLDMFTLITLSPTINRKYWYARKNLRSNQFEYSNVRISIYFTHKSLAYKHLILPFIVLINPHLLDGIQVGISSFNICSSNSNTRILTSINVCGCYYLVIYP